MKKELILPLCLCSSLLFACRDKGPMIIRPVNNAPLLSKVTGILALTGDRLLFIKPVKGEAVYVLEGKEAEGMKGLAGRRMAVVGKMKVPMPAVVDGIPVKYNIEVSSYSVDAVE